MASWSGCLAGVEVREGFEDGDDRTDSARVMARSSVDFREERREMSVMCVSGGRESEILGAESGEDSGSKSLETMKESLAVSECCWVVVELSAEGAIL